MKFLSVTLSLALLVGGCTTYQIASPREAAKVSLLKQLGPKTTQVVSFDSAQMDANNNEKLHGSGSGTGFVVKFKGKKFVMTNAHVCGSAERQVRLYQSREAQIYMKAEIVAYSEPADLCLLQTEFTNLSDGIELQETNDVSKYEAYGTVGSNGLSDAQVPQTGLYLQTEIANGRLDESVDLELLNLDQDASRAGQLCAPPSKLMKQHHPAIPGLWRYICMMSEMQHIYDFTIIPGSSGSAVISLETGKLVGVISQYVHQNRYYGGAIPVETVRDFLNRNVK